MGFGFGLEWIGNWRRRPLLTTTMNHTCCPDNTVARNDGVGGDGAPFYTDAGGGGAPTMHTLQRCRFAGSLAPPPCKAPTSSENHTRLVLRPSTRMRSVKGIRSHSVNTMESFKHGVGSVTTENAFPLGLSHCIFIDLTFATSSKNMILWRTLVPTIRHQPKLLGRERALASVRPSGIGEHRAHGFNQHETPTVERSGLRWCGHSTENEQGTISIEWEGKRTKIGGVSCRTNQTGDKNNAILPSVKVKGEGNNDFNRPKDTIQIHCTQDQRWGSELGRLEGGDKGRKIEEEE